MVIVSGTTPRDGDSNCSWSTDSKWLQKADFVLHNYTKMRLLTSSIANMARYLLTYCRVGLVKYSCMSCILMKYLAIFHSDHGRTVAFLSPELVANFFL